MSTAWRLSIFYPLLISFLLGLIFAISKTNFDNYSSLERMRSLNQLEIAAWRKIRNNLDFLFSVKMEGNARETIQKQMQYETARLLTESIKHSRQFSQELELYGSEIWLSDENINFLNDIEYNKTSKDLIKLVRSITKAPTSLLTAGTSAWDNDLVLALQSESAFKPLSRRENLLAERKKTVFGTLWNFLTLVSASVLVLVWLAWFKIVTPAFREIANNQQRLSAILNSLGEGVVAVDRKNKIANVNKVVQEKFLSEEPSVGSDIDAIFKPAEQSSVSLSELISTSVESSAKRAESKIKIIKKNGTEMPVLATATPVVDQNSGINGAVVVLRDMTREESLRKRLQRTDRFRSLDQLVGGIAHDFNNLLAGISGSAEIIKLKYSKGTPKQVREMVDRILAQAGRASDLTEKLTNFTTKKVTGFKPVTLGDCIEDVIAILRRTDAKNISLIFHQHVSEAVVMGSDGLLQSAILNLLLNAIHEVDPARGEVNIILDMENMTKQKCKELEGLEIQPGRYFSISVSDNGPGISSSIMDKIFDPFFTTKPYGKGKGLGLSATYGVIRDHRGTIYSENLESGGAKFTILLPAISDEVNASLKGPANFVHSSGENPLKTKLPIKVLLAEDEPEQRTIYLQMLQTLGLDVTPVGDGAEALELLDKAPKKFDIVLADISMPSLTGTDLLLASRSRSLQVQFILMSGYADRTEMEKLSSFSDVQFLKKPFRIEELREMISNLHM